VVLFGKAAVAFWGEIVIAFFQFRFFLKKAHTTKIPNSYLAVMIVWVNRLLLRKKFRGMALWPFVLVREPSLKEDAVFLNHESIHLRQQAEMLLLFFYLWYGMEFLCRWVQYRNRYQAYKNISFEREAYKNEKDLHYRKQRSFWNFVKYL
tara:strand:- start:134 stop:583 length:450 start_codon:yes stop_codon:yes gene_type:complete